VTWAERKAKADERRNSSICRNCFGARHAAPARLEEHLQPRPAAGGAGRGRTEIRDLLASDDTARMLDALRTLGVGVEPLGDGALASAGVGGVFRCVTPISFSATPGRLSGR
jgi:hypothetical protein